MCTAGVASSRIMFHVKRLFDMATVTAVDVRKGGVTPDLG